MWINEIIVTIKIFYIKTVLIQPSFETRPKLHKPPHNEPSILYVHNYWLIDVMPSVCSLPRNKKKGQMFWDFLSTY